MKIDDDGHPVLQDVVHGLIEVREVILGKMIGIAVLKHGRRVDAQANMVEAHLLHESDVVGRGVSIEMRGIVLTRIDLREPLTRVDPVA